MYSFSIYNDTEQPVWVYIEFCYEELLENVDTIGKFFTLGAEFARIMAASGDQKRPAIKGSGNRSSSGNSEGTMFGLNSRQWQYTRDGAQVISRAAVFANDVISQKNDIERPRRGYLSPRQILEKEQEGYIQIKPGRKHVKQESFNSNWNVHMIRSNGQMTRHICKARPASLE